MKSYFYKQLVLACLCAGGASAVSLYDTAPNVGLPESHTASYKAYVNVGYDSNVNTSHSNEADSPFVSAGLGATFADYESIDKISYRFNLGMTRYLSSDAGRAGSYGSGGKNSYADCGLTGTIVHAFNSRSSYSAALNLSYSPEPDYATGISAARRQGECFNWAFNNSYSHSIDARWSWNVSCGYSGILYSETEYQSDDRQYYTAGAGLRYRSSELLSYKVDFSYKNDQRDVGYNSDNITLMVGFDRSLDPISSCSFSVGVQQKFIRNKEILSPNLRFGYNRKAAEGLSVNSYVSLANENVDTYRGPNANYLSDLAWRIGVNAVYTLSPDVSFNFGISFMRTNYTEGTYGIRDEVNNSWNPSIGMTYRFTENLTGTINYRYTFYDSDSKNRNGDYTRHVITTGLSYNF